MHAHHFRLPWAKAASGSRFQFQQKRLLLRTAGLQRAHSCPRPVRKGPPPGFLCQRFSAAGAEGGFRESGPKGAHGGPQGPADPARPRPGRPGAPPSFSVDLSAGGTPWTRQLGPAQQGRSLESCSPGRHPPPEPAVPTVPQGGEPAWPPARGQLPPRPAPSQGQEQTFAERTAAAVLSSPGRAWSPGGQPWGHGRGTALLRPPASALRCRSRAGQTGSGCGQAACRSPAGPPPTPRGPAESLQAPTRCAPWSPPKGHGGSRRCGRAPGDVPGAEPHAANTLPASTPKARARRRLPRPVGKPQGTTPS